MKKLLILPTVLSIGLYSFPQHPINGSYAGANNSHIAFPIGAMGAGMFCLEGTGAIARMSVRHHPDIFNEPVMFAALYIKEKGAKVLEGPENPLR
jgi:hypothetical protein